MSYPGSEFDASWQSLLAPQNYENPIPPTTPYHLAVIGAGPAGLITAIVAAGLGARVALIERHMMGGDCLNVGCVPSKALLEYTAANPGSDFGAAFSWMREVRAGIAPHDSIERYREAGVDVYIGSAKFDSRDQISIGDQPINARRYVIATGAQASVPPVPGLQEANALTNESVFNLTEQPKRLAILGGGAIGCELAQVFARLGTEVHIFEMAQRLLPLESHEAGAALAESMQQLGVALHLGAGVESVSGTGPNLVSAGGEQIEVDKVLVALGRKPNTDGLALKLAGINTDKRGLIVVDSKLRTTNSHIFAAGDCASQLQFTHHADAQARVIVQNALFLPTAKADKFVVPRCTYTHPEVASIGRGEAELSESGVSFERFSVRFDELDRGRADPDGGGFAEVLTKKGSDRILGATIVGRDAGEQIASIGLLMSNGLGLKAAGKSIVTYPTRAEYLKRLADAYTRSRFTPLAAKTLKTWLDRLV